MIIIITAVDNSNYGNTTVMTVIVMATIIIMAIIAIAVIVIIAIAVRR